MSKTFLNHHNIAKWLKTSMLILLIMTFSVVPSNNNPYFFSNYEVMAAESTPEIAINNNILAAKGSGIVILKGDGTVAVGGNNNVNQYDARNWTNIKSVYKYLTDIYGLTNDGKVKFTARDKKSEILESWTDVVMLSVKNHIMGLKSDGTVYNTYAYDGTENWRNIIMITQGLGLKSDGTIEIIKSLNGTKYANEIKTWNGIVKIIAFDDCDNGAIGIKQDGTLVYTGLYFINNASLREIANWKDIVDIDVAASNHIIGLTKDGKVLVAGKPYYEGVLMNPVDLSKFTDIKAISAAEYFVVGLKNDGSIIAAGSIWGHKGDISLYIDSIK